MLNHFEKIEQLVASLDTKTQIFLSKIEETKSFKKGEILLNAGSVCRKSFHVRKGIVRKYHIKNGKEITTDFFFEDDIALAYTSYTFQEPSTEFIDCLTDVKVSITHREQWEAAKIKFPKLLELDLLLTEIHAGALEEDLLDLRTLTASERYEKLLAQAPELLLHIKLTHIASYLNISLETLSRIRAKY
ncbi:Crp/Fnr family transcriptional regulator [Flagellimonas sp. S174]|uniref:Crp/Fnr family transcriptional regulator n=1 Tax=Flagellimonas sp. S174 TaxID=3410790 RepID=UPI003BF54B31